MNSSFFADLGLSKATKSIRTKHGSSWKSVHHKSFASRIIPAQRARSSHRTICGLFPHVSSCPPLPPWTATCRDPEPALRPPHETGHPKAPGNGRRRGRCIGGAGSAGGVHVGEPKIPLPATEEGRAGDQLRPGVNWRSSDHDGTTRKMDPNHQYSRGRASGSVAT